MIFTRAIGIDLGTTNSAVAMLAPNEQEIVICKDAQGRPTTPSCVWYDLRTRNIVVGHRAYARRGVRPAPISSIKRSMGTQMNVEIGENQCSSSQVSAYILQELKRQMQDKLEGLSSPGLRYELSRAIVTVPAYFSLPAIEATREAAELAGLEVMELLHEPTAAAIYYSWKHDLGDGIYLVYDLGGGTFDVSVLRRTAGDFLVLGIFGDIFLGGDDFDRRLAEHLRRLLVADGYDLDLDVASNQEDQLRFNQLMVLAERVKKELSEQDEIILRDQGTLRDQSDSPVIVETTISRDTLEALIDDKLEETLVYCEKALQKACHKSEVTIEDVDHILLVGGSTYIPAVIEKVTKRFCQDRSDKEHPSGAYVTPIRDEPETAVALGAALRAAASGFSIGDDDKRVRLWFKGIGATKYEKTTISGHVEPLQQDLHLEGGFLRLTNFTGDLVGEAELKSGLRFVFPKVSLQAESLNDFQLEVLDSKGESVAMLQRTVTHASDQRDAVGSTLSTAVLPKPIVLEGTDGDRLVRQVLLSDGTSLPAKTQFNFAVADPSGCIRLPIYQENRIIKELQANVGEVAVGTPVKVEIACDEQVHIQVRFSVNEQEFGGSIESPPPDAVPTAYDVEQLDRSFREVLTRLGEEDVHRLRTSYERTHQDLDEARAGADYPKAIQRAADLEGLVREARLVEPLHPPLDVVESHCASCVELLPVVAEIKPEMATSSLQRDLESALDRARQAYRERDRQKYEDASQEIDASMQFLVGLTRVQMEEDLDIDATLRAIMALERTRQMTQFLMVNCLVAEQGTFFADLKWQLEEISDLEENVNTDPVGVLNRCQIFQTETKRIYQQVKPEEKHGVDLEGLLRVDAQGGPGRLATPKGLFDET